MSPSMSYERDSWTVEQRRSVSMDRQSGDRPLTSLSGLPTMLDANIPPIFTLPLFDQAIQRGQKCTFTVLGGWLRLSYTNAEPLSVNYFKVFINNFTSKNNNTPIL